MFSLVSSPALKQGEDESTQPNTQFCLGTDEDSPRCKLELVIDDPTTSNRGTSSTGTTMY